MSIVTGRGDEGLTDLLFGKRISKSDIRVATGGVVDELNANLGVARSSGVSEAAREVIDKVQEKLVSLMGEMATLPEDDARYDEQGYPRITGDDVTWLETEAQSREDDWNLRFKGWARPGKDSTLGSAQLDVARTVCRRAELAVVTFGQASIHARLFLNRLSDLLWILARGENLELS